MKYKYIIFSFIAIILFAFASCEDYLDVPRETNEILEEDIFSSYIETKDYLKQVYQYIHLLAYSPGQNHVHNPYWLMYPMAASDEYIHPGWNNRSPIMAEDLWFDVDYFTFRMADHGNRNSHNFYPIWGSAWDAIRAASVVAEKASLIQDATTEQINEIIGQALYARAFTYHCLLITHGGMPYFEYALSADDDFKFVRKSYHETVNMIVADLDAAAELLPASWIISGDDPYATQDYGRYTAAAAKGLKGRVLLYDASPLSYFADENMGYPVQYNQQERWERAAQATWEAIEFTEANGYGLLPGDSINYRKIFRGEWGTKEYLHTIIHNKELNGHNINSWTLQRMFLPGILVGSIDSRNRGVDVTQDMVDKFDAVQRNANGEIIRALPLEMARVQGFYNDQDPYADRDPRFSYNIIYHGSVKHGYGTEGTDARWNFRRDARMPGDFNDDFDKNSIYQDNQTSYYTRKYWVGESEVLYNIRQPWPWIIMRMAELYLNYAEAANQAYGPNGSAPFATMTALEAVNMVRNRVGMPNIDAAFSGSKQNLHERILNERAVELCFEFFHRFIDVRRWRIIETEAYQNSPNIMYITGSDDLENHPTGVRYEVRPWEVNNILYRRNFELKHYFLPVSRDDTQKVPAFRQNPGY